MQRQCFECGGRINPLPTDVTIFNRAGVGAATAAIMRRSHIKCGDRLFSAAIVSSPHLFSFHPIFHDAIHYFQFLGIMMDTSPYWDFDNGFHLH